MEKWIKSVPFTDKRQQYILCTWNCKTFKRCLLLLSLAWILSPHVWMRQLYRCWNLCWHLQGCLETEWGGGGLWAPSPLPSLQTPLFFLVLSISAPSLKALIVPGLTDPWDHVQQEPGTQEQSELMQADTQAGQTTSPPDLLDSICEDDQTYEDTYCSVQVPDFGLLLEHFGADEDGEAHDATNQRVKPWKNHKQSSILSLTHPLKVILMRFVAPWQ